MKRKLAGRRLNKKGEFQKGHKNSLKKRRDFVCKHHKDLNTKNNHPDNLMYLKNPPHNSLHKRAYDFLVEKNLIKEYINWFVKNFKPVLYTKNQRIKINKKVTSELRAEKGGDAKC